MSVESFDPARLHRLEGEVDELAELAGRLIEHVELLDPQPRLRIVSRLDSDEQFPPPLDLRHAGAGEMPPPSDARSRSAEHDERGARSPSATAAVITEGKGRALLALF